MVTYSTSSPWAKTPIRSGPYLDTLKIRPIPAESDDFLYTVEPQYTHRPDLLSYDLYDTPKLWWIFAQRNMDVIRDPIFDLVPGVQIFIPKIASVKRELGL